MAERNIGGSIFTVNPLTAMRSFTLQPRLLPAVAEFATLYGMFMRDLLGLAATVDVAKLEEDVAEALPLMLPILEQAAPVIARVCAKLPPAELQAITRELLAGATMDGVELFTANGDPFDIKLRGRTLDTWRLVIFALEVSYPDFFALVAGNRGRAPAPNPSAASSTSATPGPAGGS